MAEQKPKTVSIIHREEALVNVFEAMIGPAGYGYKTASHYVNSDTTPAQVARMVQEDNSDLVLLAVNFTKYDTPIPSRDRAAEGLNALDEIKDDVPVVMVTGAGDIYKDEALKRGATGYLGDTTNFDLLKKLIESSMQD